MRLTIASRKVIVQEVLTRAFNKPVCEMIKRAQEFVVRMYHEGLGEEDLKRIQSLPRGWLPMVSEFGIAFAGGPVRLHLSGTLHSYALPSAFRICGGNQIVFEKLPLPQSKLHVSLRNFERGSRQVEEFELSLIHI